MPVYLDLPHRKLSRPVIFGAVFAIALTSAGAAADLAPYRAAYTLRLDSSASGATVVDAHGAMTAEWVETCDGWTVQQRIVLEPGRNLVGNAGVLELVQH